ncbi:hypothetical protein IV435_06080 [Rahnella sp. SAP-29]|nr:Gp138 family membrane-puncturing spike protein [Rahnella laticis]MBF7994091.1 hypothetical protein [Rahnella laticis]
MPITSNDLSGDLSQALKAMGEQLSSTLRVAVPAIIQSFDPDTVTCTVQPAVNGSVPDEAGAESTEGLTLLVDLPVVFPRGGGVTLTFPVKAGDECLVIFSDRCIDFWYQSGGTGDAVDERQHDTSDAFVIVGPQSQVKKISGISSSGAQLRTDDGAAFIEVAAGHDITVNTPGKLTASAQGGTVITSPTIVLNGAVTINGTLSQGMGESGGSATMLGPITVTNDVTAGGKSLQNHVHSGVQTGSGQTGKPV